jgi:adenosylhomocysteine nucleosidase
METAAVGHVAYANGVPYIGVRSISDMAGANPTENRVESFAPIAARNAATVVRALLRELH